MDKHACNCDVRVEDLCGPHQAAPEMLEALKALVATVCATRCDEVGGMHEQETCVMARAAIAKATEGK